MNTSEKITLWLAQLRASGRAVVFARLAIAVTGTVALVVPAVQSWDQLDLIPIVAVPVLLATVVLPDSPAGFVFVLVVTLGWLMRAPAEISWSLVLTALVLVVLHLATAFAAQIPSYARVHPAALRRWWLPTAIALLLVLVVALAAGLIQGADVAGSLVVTVVAMALATGTIWFAAGQKLDRD
ncbi:hypothetical protein ACIA58_29760 [Kribbella sp. NPDC051586]|uniref:hypothetical protein n=1 Tax=Kribbella sp. NPDC051586 TaxID=3364118 RepID=UPI0037BC26A6